MRFAKLTALLVPAITASACYIDIDDPYYSTNTGDLTLRYAFEGQPCDRAGVSRIFISMRGRHTGDTFTDLHSCSVFDGITIENLLEDTYDVRIEGRGPGGEVLYNLAQRQVEVTAFRHQSYSLDVPFAMAATGELSIYWTFDGFGDCYEVADVRVRIWGPEGALYEDTIYPCDFGGVLYDSARPGTWSVSLEGLSPSGRLLYAADDRLLDVFAGASNDYTIDLYPTM